jgi:hypothetical protein
MDEGRISVSVSETAAWGVGEMHLTEIGDETEYTASEGTSA